MKLFKEQFVPIFLTVLTFIFLVVGLFILLTTLNKFTFIDVVLKINLKDVLIGLTIYLKTSFDFAIFIADVMASNPGWKKRVSIEIGSSLGNAFGTMVILIIWIFFKEVHILLAAMIFIAALVLFQMAEESLEEFIHNSQSSLFINISKKILKTINFINKIFHPLLSRIIPPTKIKSLGSLSFLKLAIFSFSIPFILGLDDFAGYIPIFSIVNVFGFCVGVFLGHMILNGSLFLSPSRTIKIAKNPAILFIGSLAFIILGIYGLLEIIKLFT